MTLLEATIVVGIVVVVVILVVVVIVINVTARSLHVVNSIMCGCGQ